MNLEEIGKYITVLECKENDILSYVNYVDSFGFNIKTFRVKFTESDFEKIEDKVIDLIDHLQVEEDDGFYEDMGEKILRLKLNKGNAFIAVKGRIGNAQKILCSKSFYEKHHTFLNDYSSHNVFITKKELPHIYLYRKNNMDQESVIILHDNDRYNIAKLGRAETQFYKIPIYS